MSIRMPGGRFFTDSELLLLLPNSKIIISSHIRNGGGTSPLLALATEIYNDASGITTVPVYAKDGALVGMVSSADIDPLDESAASRGADRLVDGRQNPPIDALSVNPGEAYLCTKEIAERLGIPGETGMRIVRKELLERRLHGEQLGGTNSSWMVAESEVERWVAEQQQPQ